MLMAISGNIISLLGFYSKPFPLTIGCLKGGRYTWYSGTQYKAATIRSECVL